jgi:hypothetical protein
MELKGKIIISVLTFMFVGLIVFAGTANLDSKLADNVYSSNVQKVQEVGDYKLKIDYNGGANPVYIGKARANATVTEAIWQIKYINYSGSNPTEILWANSTSDFNYRWDRRTNTSWVVYN